MPGLHELQDRFARAIWGDEEPLLAYIRGNGLKAVSRFGIYRNNLLGGLVAALRDGFPVVERLVGAVFFEVMAGDFVRVHPPRGPCLLEYGGTFPAFIAGYQPAAGLAYLPDVARLEWAWNDAFHSEEGNPVTLDMLLAVPPDDYPRVGLSLHPSARLVNSRWPVLHIYQVNQPDFEGDDAIDLNMEAGSKTLVLRPGCEVELHTLGDGEFTFLSMLADGSDLETALVCAAMTDNTFDAMAALLRGMQSAFFSQLTIAPRSTS